MALLDISLVTTALMTLLKRNIEINIDTGVTVTVTPESPDKVGTVLNHLSVYLYHVAEESFYKNQQAPGSDARGVANTPMGLCLYYVLTAHHDTGTPASDPLTQQKLMGYALKTMHDYPIVVDGTTIGAFSILPVSLQGDDNPLQIIMRPVTPEDTLAFWGTEDQQTARLSAYYEVRVIMLEPEQPETYAAPVLSLGTYLYQLGTPHLERSRSQLPFTLPPSGDSLERVLEVSPARASTDDSTPPDHDVLELLGSNLTIGTSRQVWLRSALFSAGAGGPLPVDLTLVDNQSEGWALSQTGDGNLSLTLAELLYYDDGGGAPLPSIAVLPGHYTAFVRVTVGERVVGGQLLPITHDSNEIALTVIPWIASVSQLVDVFTLTVAGFPLDDPDLDVQLYVDGLRFAPVSVLASGGFKITGTATLDFQKALDAGEHTVRLLVNGAESQPLWFVSA